MIDRKSNRRHRHPAGGVFEINVNDGVVSQKTYSEVTGYWVQKLVTSDSSHTPSESSSWIGLGGYTYQNLIQMGTYSSTGDYSPWYEIVNTSADTGGSIKISSTNFPYTVGDEFYGDVWWTTSGSYGTAHFYIVDTTHSASYGFSVPNITSYNGVTSSAEWIFERPAISGLSTYYLSKVANVPFSFCSAGPQGGTLSHPDPYDPSTWYIKMEDYSTGVTMANETTIDYSGNYSAIWVDYGSGK